MIVVMIYPILLVTLPNQVVLVGAMATIIVSGLEIHVLVHLIVEDGIIIVLLLN